MSGKGYGGFCSRFKETLLDFVYLTLASDPLDKSLSSGETQGDFTGLGYPIGKDLFRGDIALTTFSTSGERSQVGIGDIQTSILLGEPRVGLHQHLCVQRGNRLQNAQVCRAIETRRVKSSSKLRLLARVPFTYSAYSTANE